MKINIGGQKGRKCFPKDWKIVDISLKSDYVVDIGREKLPFKNNFVSNIYTSHTLEHVFPDQLSFVFLEMFRVLEKKGKIRVVVPDFSLAVKAYCEKDISFLKDTRQPAPMPWMPKNMLCTYMTSWGFSYGIDKDNNRKFTGHKVLFDSDLLKFYMEKAGFSNIKCLEYNKCSKVFYGCDFKRYENCSVYMEGEKI